MSSDDLVIQASNLGKTYSLYRNPRDQLAHLLLGRTRNVREFRALDNVSFQVKRGETLGIIGRNGSGKSTLLQILSGTLRPTHGDVRLSGRLAALLELGAGFNPEFTGRENVMLGASVYGMTEAQIAERFDDIAAFADIGEFIDQPVKTYSSGMFVRLAFSLHVHTDPEIFLVDEAMAVGDHRFVQKCFRRLNALKESGASILLVSHDTTAIKMLCDRAIWLDSGKVREMGNAPAVVDAYRNWSDDIGAEVIASRPEMSSHRALRIEVPQPVLMNLSGQEVSSFTHGDHVAVRIEIRNRAVPAGQTFRVGFSLRNNRAIEIAGSNTDIAPLTVPVPPTGGSVAVCMEFQLPLLAGGRYSLTFSIDSKSDADKATTEVLMPDCIVFDVDERVKVYTLLGIDARFSLEESTSHSSADVS
ncbi:hypothetical protein RD110_04295 [Rhodoferax koreense]|uniref:ABC transporter domain-containing protein n=1 Tax=Rhodoferax koreensis TaxID=1842727 RepID=A0A1P8JS12_9BURK|nr:ABC transporter ATP-binding protein [Rhodoferax koreense]APW36521.1 hypothetical protein RD110_04295 [Rhodoferax koreense]